MTKKTINAINESGKKLAVTINPTLNTGVFIPQISRHLEYLDSRHQ